MHRAKTIVKPKCINCAEERRKADRSRKYAHELKNIFITISTVINSEMDSSSDNNISVHTDSGEASPFIMEGRRQRIHQKRNSIINNNHNDSPFFFF